MIKFYIANIYKFAVIIKISATINVLPNNVYASSVILSEYNPLLNLNNIIAKLDDFVKGHQRISNYSMDVNHDQEVLEKHQKNFMNFIAAENEIFKLADLFNCSTKHPNKQKQRIMRIKFYLEITKNFHMGVVVYLFTHVLTSFCTAYSILENGNMELFQNNISIDFLRTFASLQNKIYFCTYLQLLPSDEVDILLLSKDQNIIPDKKQPKTLQIDAFKSLIQNNLFYFFKLMLVTYDASTNQEKVYKSLVPTDPIFRAYNVVLKSEFFIFSLEKTLVTILNKLVARFLNTAGLFVTYKKVKNALFYYSETVDQIKGVSLKHLSLQKYNKCESTINFTDKILDKFEFSCKSFGFLLNLCSKDSKIEILTQMIFLVLFGYEKIIPKKIIETWTFLICTSSDIHKACSYDIFLQLMINKIEEPPTDITEESMEKLEASKKVIDEYNYSSIVLIMSQNCSYEFIVCFLQSLTSAKKLNLSKTLILQIQGAFLKKLLSENRILRFDKINLTSLNNIFSNILQNIILIYNEDFSHEICDLMTPILDIIFSLLSQSIKSVNLDLCLSNLELFLQIQENFKFYKITIKMVDNLFIYILETKNHPNQPNNTFIMNYSERIANITFKCFLIFIDLDIKYNYPQKEIADTDIMINIVDCLLKRNFKRLKFSIIKNEPLRQLFLKNASDRNFACFRMLCNLYICNMILCKRTHDHLNMILIDILQIRFRLSKNFSSLEFTNLRIFFREIRFISDHDIYYTESGNIKTKVIAHNKKNYQFYDEEKVINFISYEPKNDHEFFLICIFDALFTLQRFRYADNINILRLNQIIANIESIRLKQFDESIMLLNFSEIILLFDLTLFIHMMLSETKLFKENKKYMLGFFVSELFLVQNKLYNLFMKTENHQNTYFLNFIIIKAFNLFKQEELTDLPGFTKNFSRLKESTPAYFTDYKDVNLIYFNFLFEQLIICLNLKIMNKTDPENLSLPLLSDNKIFSYESFMGTHDVFLIPTTDLANDILKYIDYDDDGFLFNGLIHKFIGIRELIFFLLFKRIELTVDYCNANLKLCYFLCAFRCKAFYIVHVFFENFDKLIALHINNCQIWDNFNALCGIVDIYKNRNPNLESQNKNLECYIAAKKRAAKMQWKHRVLRD